MAQKRKKVIPRLIQNRSTPEKKPGFVHDPDLFDLEKPVWLLSALDLDGEFGWNSISKEEFCKAVLPKLRNFESMTWNEILKQNNHVIEVSKLGSVARDRLVLIKQDDIETLISLRLEGKKRVWGIRKGFVFKLLWWDPEHKVYPYEKKHT